MQGRVDFNVKTLSVSRKTFFMAWLKFLKPYHKLRLKEMKLLALLLYKRYELSKEISNEKIIIKLLFDTETRKEIQKEMGYSSLQVLSNMIYSLKKSKILDENNYISPGLIPNIQGNNFKLVFNFNINE